MTTQKDRQRQRQLQRQQQIPFGDDNQKDKQRQWQLQRQQQMPFGDDNQKTGNGKTVAKYRDRSTAWLTKCREPLRSG
jgi:hypothetical protein